MKLNIDFNAKEQMALLTFPVEEFTSEREFSVAISIISTFSADFDLDPELEKEDLQEIIERAISEDKDSFTFEICEDGIEVSF